MRGNRWLAVGQSALELCVLMFFLGCSSSPSKVEKSSEGSVSLIGAGSTLVYPIMTRWTSAFQGSQPEVQINYQSIGSGGGIQQIRKGLIDFAASDAPLDDEQLKGMSAVIQIPEIAGPVCITYNLPGLQSPLKLSAATLAGIYLGTVKNWQDPALQKDNPGVALPNASIFVTHRSDGSGTTSIFTTYLSKISPEWAQKVGKGIAVSWPVGLGAKGSEGVTGIIKGSAGAIGYVDLAYAKQNNLASAMIRNQAGNWQAPTERAATAAIDAFQAELAKDIRISIVDPPATAKDAYPITGLTYLILPKDGDDSAKRAAVKNFVEYILKEGQALAPSLDYARLPPALLEQNRQLLDGMLVNGKSLAAAAAK